MGNKQASLPPISKQIWDMKYRLKKADGSREKTIQDTFKRVARAAARAEPAKHRQQWQGRFYAAMKDFEFLPAGRILAGAGAGRDVTLFNCFVMGQVKDDMGSIFSSVKQAALTMQQGGGIGQDFSPLRPRGAPVKGVGADASGPVSFMDVWDAMCGTVMSAGSRRGAMMATLRCDHPDIEEFIDAKADPQRLRQFNLSVLVTDDFMTALQNNADWPLRFGGKTYKTLPARHLWQRIMRATYDYAEPGVIFIDRINQRNNLDYCETIFATNPCGEQPLPPHGACLLGSINLAALVSTPFAQGSHIDEQRLGELVTTAVRFLDNCIDISRFPLKQQKKEAINKRRIGLGVTGLGDALAMCGLHYGSEKARRAAGRWMKLISHAAYLASAELAAEKGAFPAFKRKSYLKTDNIRNLPPEIRAKIRTNGIRNGLLTSIAPTGTISLLAGNVSSGIEPPFDMSFERRISRPGAKATVEQVEDHAYRQFRKLFGPDKLLPDYFVTARDLPPEAHLEMQAALQTHVDSSISKTINCDENIDFKTFRSIYEQAYDLGLKGCTTYRPNKVTGSILSSSPKLTQDLIQKEPAGSPQPHHISRKTQDEAQTALPLNAPSPPLPPVAITPAGSTGDIVYMAEPLQRDAMLAGFTYKLKWPDSDHATYVTINDIVQDGRRRPFEIFINSKNLEHYAWTVALTRMISAVFRRGGDVSFVVEELQAIFDPRGGQWVKGRYVPSILAAIGDIIETHMLDTGFISAPIDGLVGKPGDENEGDHRKRLELAVNDQRDEAGRPCPKCYRRTLIFQEGCHICRNCGYSRCS